jgi:hypothetical protein
VYGTKIHRGQSVDVDTQKNMVMLDNQVVSQNSLHPGDEYRIYFDPTTTVETNSTVETDTVETSHSH